MFFMTSVFLKPQEEISEFADAHNEFLSPYYEKKQLLLASRKKDSSGGVLLFSKISEEEIKEFIEKDPYTINKIARYTYTEFHPSKDFVLKEFIAFLD